MGRFVRDEIVLFVGVLAMATASILIRLAQSEGVESLSVAAWRLALSSLLLSIPATRQRVWQEYARLAPRHLALLALSGAFLGLHFATWITSLSRTSVLSSVALVSSTPLWIGLLAPVILKEATPRQTWIGIVVALLGGAVIGINDFVSTGTFTGWGDALALLGAVFAAAYLMIGRGTRTQLSLTSYVWIVYSFAAVFLIVWALLAGTALFGHKPIATLWLILLAVIPQLIGHTAANYAVRRLPATIVGVSTLGEPVGSTLLALLLFQEAPTVFQLAGGTLILVGIGVASGGREIEGGGQRPPTIATHP